MARILMIDDDERLAAMVREYLGNSGHVVDTAADARRGLGAFHAHGADLVILDLMLPDIDGLEVCRKLRTEGLGVPILMLTAKGDPLDRVIGLELGADDYLSKPFEPRELAARVKALLRRATATEAGKVMRFGRLEIDRGARAVRIDGEPRALTPHQFDLLAALAERAGRVLSREQLMNLVRSEPFDAFDRSVDVQIARIRASIEDDPHHPRRVITVRGAGYLLARRQDAA